MPSEATQCPFSNKRCTGFPTAKQAAVPANSSAGTSQGRGHFRVRTGCERPCSHSTSKQTDKLSPFEKHVGSLDIAKPLHFFEDDRIAFTAGFNIATRFIFAFCCAMPCRI